MATSHLHQLSSACGTQIANGGGGVAAVGVVAEPHRREVEMLRNYRKPTSISSLCAYAEQSVASRRQPGRERVTVQPSLDRSAVKVRIYNSSLFQTISRLLSNAYWKKNDLRKFIAGAGVPAALLSKLPSNAAEKREVVHTLVTEMEANLDEYKPALERLVDQLLSLDQNFSHLETDDDVRARRQVQYARSALQRLKWILRKQALPGKLANAVQLNLPWISSFLDNGAEELQSRRFYSDHSSSVARAQRERGATVQVRNRCQLCYFPPDEAKPLAIHRRSSDPDTPRHQIILCADCRLVFAKAGRLRNLSGEPRICHEYDADIFDPRDKSTWLMIEQDTVSIAWAEDFGLDEWSEYCPHCGYTILNTEILDPFIMCTRCGHTTASEDLQVEQSAAVVIPDESESDKAPECDPDEYRRYLASEKWRNHQVATLDRDGRRCIICDSNNALAVHHRTYLRRFEEHSEDLVTLCQPCHDLFHLHRVVWGGGC